MKMKLWNIVYTTLLLGVLSHHAHAADNPCIVTGKEITTNCEVVIEKIDFTCNGQHNGAVPKCAVLEYSVTVEAAAELTKTTTTYYDHCPIEEFKDQAQVVPDIKTAWLIREEIIPEILRTDKSMQQTEVGPTHFESTIQAPTDILDKTYEVWCRVTIEYDTNKCPDYDQWHLVDTYRVARRCFCVLSDVTIDIECVAEGGFDDARLWGGPYDDFIDPESTNIPVVSIDEYVFFADANYAGALLEITISTNSLDNTCYCVCDSIVNTIYEEPDVSIEWTWAIDGPETNDAGGIGQATSISLLPSLTSGIYTVTFTATARGENDCPDEKKLVLSTSLIIVEETNCFEVVEIDVTCLETGNVHGIVYPRVYEVEQYARDIYFTAYAGTLGMRLLASIVLESSCSDVLDHIWEHRLENAWTLHWVAPDDNSLDGIWERWLGMSWASHWEVEGPENYEGHGFTVPFRTKHLGMYDIRWYISTWSLWNCLDVNSIILTHRVEVVQNCIFEGPVTNGYNCINPGNIAVSITNDDLRVKRFENVHFEAQAQMRDAQLERKLTYVPLQPGCYRPPMYEQVDLTHKIMATWSIQKDEFHDHGAGLITPDLPTATPGPVAVEFVVNAWPYMSDIRLLGWCEPSQVAILAEAIVVGVDRIEGIPALVPYHSHREFQVVTDPVGHCDMVTVTVPGGTTITQHDGCDYQAFFNQLSDNSGHKFEILAECGNVVNAPYCVADYYIDADKKRIPAGDTITCKAFLIFNDGDEPAPSTWNLEHFHAGAFDILSQEGNQVVLKGADDPPYVPGRTRQIWHAEITGESEVNPDLNDTEELAVVGVYKLEKGVLPEDENGLPWPTEKNTNNLVAWWSFAEGDGTHTRDQSTNAVTATCSHVQWTTNGFDTNAFAIFSNPLRLHSQCCWPTNTSALYFTGANSVTYETAQPLGPSWTIMMWLQHETTNRMTLFSSKPAPDAETGYEIVLDGYSKAIEVHGAGSRTARSTALHLLPEYRELQPVFVVVHNDMVRILVDYIDYIDLKQWWIDPPASCPTTCHIGGRADGLAGFHGIIDEVMIFNRALSYQEMRSLLPYMNTIREDMHNQEFFVEQGSSYSLFVTPTSWDWPGGQPVINDGQFIDQDQCSLLFNTKGPYPISARCGTSSKAGQMYACQLDHVEYRVDEFTGKLPVPDPMTKTTLYIAQNYDYEFQGKLAMFDNVPNLPLYDVPHRLFQKGGGGITMHVTRDDELTIRCDRTHNLLLRFSQLHGIDYITACMDNYTNAANPTPIAEWKHPLEFRINADDIYNDDHHFPRHDVIWFVNHAQALAKQSELTHTFDAITTDPTTPHQVSLTFNQQSAAVDVLVVRAEQLLCEDVNLHQMTAAPDPIYLHVAASNRVQAVSTLPGLWPCNRPTWSLDGNVQEQWQGFDQRYIQFEQPSTYILDTRKLSVSCGHELTREYVVLDTKLHVVAPDVVQLDDNTSRTNRYIIERQDEGMAMVYSCLRPHFLEQDLPTSWTMTGGTLPNETNRLFRHIHTDIVGTNIVTCAFYGITNTLILEVVPTTPTLMAITNSWPEIVENEKPIIHDTYPEILCDRHGVFELNFKLDPTLLYEHSQRDLLVRKPDQKFKKIGECQIPPRPTHGPWSMVFYWDARQPAFEWTQSDARPYTTTNMLEFKLVHP